MSRPFLRRTSNLTCFFCQSPICPAPVDPRSFHCTCCGCWNRYDAKGEIMSDEPAMHDEKLNTKSFAKRASPSKDRLPSMYGTGQFCHTCQTNQMLLVNLLSNYLPPPQHPEYAQRLEQLPAYRESLHVRYPPVCVNCSPAVEDEIQRKNQMARTKALGGWLKDSKWKNRERLVSGSGKEREKLEFQLFHLANERCSMVDNPPWCCWISRSRAAPLLPVLSLLSLFYTAWDPTYYHFKKARVQGRDVRVKGKPRYIILQMTSWFSRLITSILLALAWYSSSRDYLHVSAYPSSYRIRMYCSISLVVEILVSISSFAILHLQRPPPIRLIDTSSHGHLQPSSTRSTPELSSHSRHASPMPTAPTSSEPDLLASLTLSSKPVISPINPIFGHSSLLPSTATPTAPQGSPIKVDDSPNEDEMDWTPTNPSPLKPKKLADDDGSWLRPQRFFPPERPTGLETLFANTKLDDAETKTPNQIRMRCLGLKAVGRWIAYYQGWLSGARRMGTWVIGSD
ncbi:Ima1 N-terminal domain-containing protein [Melanogaster broomeanus]|nr:Ima1 N-terminal domain-containing protein [Melanogaster broomeanus]